MTDEKQETVGAILSDMFGSTWSEQVPLLRLRAALKRRDDALLEVAERLEREARYGDKPGEVPRFAQDGPTSRWLEREAARIRAIVNQERSKP